jgi:hypothetical protein
VIHLLVLAIHLLATIAKLMRPGGVRAVVAESVLLKHQLLISSRARRRAPNLNSFDRVVLGLASLFIPVSRLPKLAVVLKPRTLLKMHEALRKRKYRWLFSSGGHRRPGPKGPSQELIDAIVAFKRRNPRIGCPRIAQEIARTFGIDIDKDIVRRVLAKEEVEALVTKSVRQHLGLAASIDDRGLINDHVARVGIRPDQLLIELVNAKADKPKRARSQNVLSVPWHKTPSKRRREILLPDTIQPRPARPIRSETRATLIASIARGRRWLNELSTDATANAESIAKRERCSVRQVNMTISLAFLAPDLVRAAIEGRLPRGMGVTRLRDAPPEWSRQHAMLGLNTPSAVHPIATPGTGFWAAETRPAK